MAKTITRQNLKLFGQNGNSNNFGQFGSQTAGSPLKTKSITTIQALAAWLNGWQDAVITSNKAPFLEDMNGLIYVFGYELAYILQEGIPEWDGSTTYFTGSVVRKAGTREIYQSLTDDNTGNALPIQTDSINWAYTLPVVASKIIGSILDAQIDGMSASKLIGQVTSDQIASLDPTKLSTVVPLIKLPQYAFKAEPTTLSNVTGQGTSDSDVHYFTAYAAPTVNTGGAFNASTGLFTAPITGNYMFTCKIGYTSFFGNGCTNARNVIAKNGVITDVSMFAVRKYSGIAVGPTPFDEADVQIISILALTAGDVVKLGGWAGGGVSATGVSIGGVFQGTIL